MCHFRGSNKLWPLLHIFSGSKPPTPSMIQYSGGAGDVRVTCASGWYMCVLVTGVIVFSSVVDLTSSQAVKLFQSLSFTRWNLQRCYPTAVLNERMWHFRAYKILWRYPTYFLGALHPQPLHYTPLVFSWSGRHAIDVCSVCRWGHAIAILCMCMSTAVSALVVAGDVHVMCDCEWYVGVLVVVPQCWAVS